MSTLDKKGLWSYLSITFGTTFAVEGVMILCGFRVSKLPPFAGQMIIMAVMWVPAAATVFTTKVITHEGLGIARIRLGSLKPYLQAAVLIPLCFFLIYGLTWLFGRASPDWQLTSLRKLMHDAGATSDLPIPPQMFLWLLLGATLFITPFMNSVFGFGEEMGWRGYLLPKLMPLGKTRAYILVGVLWGLWHAPLIAVGFNYPGYPVWGIFFMIAMTTALSLYMNEMTLFYQSSILAGWIHGVINSQGYGVWRILFPDTNPLIGGFTGVIGVAVFAALGYWQMRRFRKREEISPRLESSVHELSTTHLP
jgi:hypothetical protein